MDADKQNIEQVENKLPFRKKRTGRKAGAIMFPHHSLKEALRVPKSIWDDNAGNPFPIGDLAKKLGYSPTTGIFKDLIRSANRYGLVEGSWVQDVTKTIQLTSLGESIVAPTSDTEYNANMLKALQTPEVFHAFLDSINGKPIPSSDVCENTLIRVHHILPSDVEICCSALMKNINELGLIEEYQRGKKYLRLDKLKTITSTQSNEELEGPLSTENEQVTLSTEEQDLSESTPEPKPKRIFVAHGKNKAPLEQLEKILRQFKVNYIAAVNEPNAGRPVSEKVATAMTDSSSGIFIFTADERTTDKEGTEVWRPSQNVVFELGAASVLYGKKIVILKEEDVSFASNFSDLAYIPFKKDRLGDKTADLMLELVELGFIQITPT